MRVFYAGCNLFGQITGSTEISFEEFHEFRIEKLRNLVIGHSVLVVQTEDGVFMHGHGLKPRTTHSVTELKLPCAGKVRDISTSDTRIFMLDDAGELYLLDFLDKDVQIRRKPNFVIKNCSSEIRIVRFVCGIGINVALSEGGKVFNAPNELDFANEAVVQTTAGNEHALILDANGNVYSFGKGKRGQLGHGTLDDEDEPRLIEALAGIKIIKIASGSWHCCALSRDGDVFLWGWNSDGQLGLFDEKCEISQKNCPKIPVSVIALPTLADYDFGDKNVINIGCGSRHTILITEDKAVYGCGCNQFNQLAIKSQPQVYALTKIYTLQDDAQLYDIKCGPAATAILLR